MKDLDTLGVLGTQKTVFFQEQPVELIKKIEKLEQQKRKVIALIKDGRFVEALQEFENETLA